MANSQKPKTNCFSTIANRFILCKGSFPTHPSDNITETKTGENDDQKIYQNLTESKNGQIAASTTTTTAAPAPGLVARLMGLDTIPDFKWVPKSDSFPRSKSVNSMDYLIDFTNSPSSRQRQQQHRRVRTSVSFREGSTGLSNQNHEYFIFFLDNVDENKELRSNVMRAEMGFEDLKQQRKTGEFKKNREKIVVVKKNIERKSFKGNDEVRRVRRKPCTVSNRRNVLPPVNQKVVPAATVEYKFTEKKKKRSNQLAKKTESKTEHESVLSVDVDSRPTISKSRRKSIKNRTNLEFPSSNNKRVVPNNNEALIKKTDKKASNVIKEETDYTTMLSDIRNLTGEENSKEPNWVASKKDLEEFSIEFEHQILDQMLHQMLHELNELLIIYVVTSKINQLSTLINQ